MAAGRWPQAWAPLAVPSCDSQIAEIQTRPLPSCANNGQCDGCCSLSRSSASCSQPQPRAKGDIIDGARAGLTTARSLANSHSHSERASLAPTRVRFPCHPCSPIPYFVSVLAVHRLPRTSQAAYRSTGRRLPAHAQPHTYVSPTDLPSFLALGDAPAGRTLGLSHACGYLASSSMTLRRSTVHRLLGLGT